MVQNIKKYFKNFLLISGGILMASCNTKPIENEQFDYSKYPLYNENVDSIEYKFNGKEISDPFYKGNVVYNESVLLTKDDETGEISGNLMFKPTKILAVKDYTLKTKDYRQDVDFTLDGNKIIKKEGSDIPYRTHAELVGESIPEGYRLVTQISNQLTDLVNMGGAIYTESPFYYGSQLWVSYVYDVKEIDPNLDKYPTFNDTKISRTIEKLKNKEEVKIVGLGDSVLEGCSSSKKFNHEPYMDTFIEMVKDNLSSLYGTTVNLKNLSVGGTQSSWGCQAQQINNIVAEQPDLLFLHFGINDLGSQRATIAYADDMESIILDIQSKLPNCDIILLSPFAPNNLLYDYDKMQEYVDVLKGFEETYDHVQLIDIFSLSKEMTKNKKYLDMSANGINHVNDFASRVYLQAILSTMYDYSNK